MLDLIGSSLTVFVFLALLVIFVLFKTALVVPNQQAVQLEALKENPLDNFLGLHEPDPPIPAAV